MPHAEQSNEVTHVPFVSLILVGCEQLSLARDIMSYYGAIIIVPKDALVVSSEYEVAVELSSHPDVEWSFRTFTPAAEVEALDVDYGVQIR